LKIDEIPYEIKTFSNSKEEMKFIIRHGLCRRHLNDWQKTTLGKQLLKLEKEKAKQRQRDHGGTAPGRKTLRENLNTSDKERATQKVADQIGVSETKIKKRNKIDKVQEQVKDNPVLSKKLNDKITDAVSNKTTIDDVYKTALKVEQNNSELPLNPDKSQIPQLKEKKWYPFKCPQCKYLFQVRKEKDSIIVKDVKL